MIDIKIIASSSSGNCYLIKDDEKTLLIDPGIKYEDIQQATDFAVAGIDFCLVTHEHKDHCQAIEKIAKLGVPLMMSQGTFDALDLLNSNFHKIVSENHFEYLGWKVLPFEVAHDANEPLGFLIKSPSGSKILFATDTHYIKYSFSGVTHYMVECNHSKELLLANEHLAPELKYRIMSTHFELENVKEFFRHQDLSQTIAIFLLHLSDTNSDHERFIREIQEVTGKPVY